MIGQTISHYKILEKLGEGGMGVVYKAQDTKLDRFVALKFLPPHLTAEETERARFLQEAKSAATLNHPNICTIYGIEEFESRLFIEMEFVDGVTLREKIPVQKSGDAVNYAIQIAEALQEAHIHGIVHRDVKSENIMLNAKNQVKVMDFGLAKLKGSIKLTRTSSTVGTLAYMAPEQIQGSDVDARSDIFSFGVVLFELLTGQLPFHGEHEAAIMYSIVNEEAEIVEKYLPGVSPILSNVIQRCLEKEPAARYQSAADIAIELRRVQKQSTRVSSASLSSVSNPGSDISMIEPVNTRKKISRNITIGLGAVVLLSILAILYKFFLAGSSGSLGRPFSAVNMTRLTTSGKGYAAAISPDGKYVVHGVLEGEQSSLVVRQVATMSNVTIIPPAITVYVGLTFSIDGNYVYFVVSNHDNPNGALFQIPVLGGTPQKILSDLITPVTLSPDGKQVAFVRRKDITGEEALMIANADGTGQRALCVLRGDEFFILNSGVAPSWSPDGAMIAISASSNRGGQHTNLVGFSVTDGSKKVLTPENWRQIGRVVWLPNAAGIMFVATRVNSTNAQIWYLPYPNGTIESTTNDLADYEAGTLGLTTDGGTIVAAPKEIRSNIWVLNAASTVPSDWNESHAVQLTSGVGTGDGNAGMDWTPDDRIIYSSTAGGTASLWSIDNDGRNQHQLTNATYDNYNPSVSNDGRLIIFASRKDTTSHIFKMDSDGSNPVKLSLSEDYVPRISPDGKWVYYSGWATGKVLLYKIPLSGGDTVCLSSNPASNPKISPNGQLLLCDYFDVPSQKWGNAILTNNGAVLQRYFQLPYSANKSSADWSIDGKSITYIDTKNGISNIWEMPSEGGEPSQLTHFNAGLISWFVWSKDGKYLAISRAQVTSDVVLITEKK